MESGPSEEADRTLEHDKDAALSNDQKTLERSIDILSKVTFIGFLCVIPLGLWMRKTMVRAYSMQYSLLQASLEMQRGLTYKTTNDLDRIVAAFGSLRKQISGYEGDLKEVRRCLNHDAELTALRNKLNDSEQKRKSEIKTLQDQIDRYKGSIRKLIEEYDKKKAEAELLAKRRATTPSPKPTTPILGGGFDAYIKLLKINLQQDLSENHDKHEN